MLYVFNAEGTVLYKIGFTSGSVNNRLRQLQTGSGYKIIIIWFADIENARLVEKTTHRFYSNYKTIGEWFLFDEVSVENVIEKIKQIENNIKLIKENEKNSD